MTQKGMLLVYKSRGFDYEKIWVFTFCIDMSSRNNWQLANHSIHTFATHMNLGSQWIRIYLSDSLRDQGVRFAQLCLNVSTLNGHLLFMPQVNAVGEHNNHSCWPRSTVHSHSIKNYNMASSCELLHSQQDSEPPYLDNHVRIKSCWPFLLLLAIGGQRRHARSMRYPTIHDKQAKYCQSYVDGMIYILFNDNVCYHLLTILVILYTMGHITLIILNISCDYDIWYVIIVYYMRISIKTINDLSVEWDHENIFDVISNITI